MHISVKNITVLFIFLVTLFFILSFTGCCFLFNEEKEETGQTVSVTGELNHDYRQSEMDYFYEIALGAEYGSSDNAVHKWVDDIRIDIKGSPTEKDIKTINQVVSELNYLIYGITLDIVNWDPDIEIYFYPRGKFYSIEPNYVSGNDGFFWAWWDENGSLYKARILIATDGVTQEERSHLIREELTQSLGMMNDSYEYEDSIFYQGWTDVQSYTDLDEAVISILYDPEIKLGMSMEEVEDVLNSGNR